MGPFRQNVFYLLLWRTFLVALIALVLAVTRCLELGGALLTGANVALLFSLGLIVWSELLSVTASCGPKLGGCYVLTNGRLDPPAARLRTIACADWRSLCERDLSRCGGPVGLGLSACERVKRQIMALTAKRVHKLTKPGRYHDGGGLYFQVTSPSNRSWLLRYQRHGQERWMGWVRRVNSILAKHAKEPALPDKNCKMG